MVERWKDVPAYEGLYQVSDHGRVLGQKGHILRPGRDRLGYRTVVFSRQNHKKTFRIRHFSTTRRKSGRPQNSRLLDRAIQDVDMWRNRAISQHAVIETLIEIGLPPRVGLIKKDGWYIGVIQEQPAP